MLPSATASIDAAVLGEAADWLVCFQSGEATHADREQFERWRARSAQHRAAWERASAVMDLFGQVPSRIGHQTLEQLPKPTRRRLLQGLGAIAAVGPAGWLAWRHGPWQEWTADWRTATGEQRSITLADGTQLVLNTATAIDMRFTADVRRVQLVAGEVLVTTAHDSSPVARPFVVESVHGTMRALGTRFAARMMDEATRLAVFEGAVQLQPAADLQMMRRIEAGEQAEFTARSVRDTRSVDASAALWEQGMLVARDVRLGDLLAEFARYHTGVLRCDPLIAGMPVSGAFSLRDIPASLDLLRKTLPVRISTITPYWTTVQSR